MAGDENAPGAAPVGSTLRYTVMMTNKDGYQYGRHVLGRGVEEAIGHAMAGAAVERREDGGDDDKPLEWADLDEEVEAVYYNHRGEVPAYDWWAIALRSEEICDEAVARVAEGDEETRYRIGQGEPFPPQSPELDAAGSADQDAAAVQAMSAAMRRTSTTEESDADAPRSAASRAALVLRDYSSTDPLSALSDIISDLRHWADTQGGRAALFNECYRVALRNHAQEAHDAADAAREQEADDGL